MFGESDSESPRTPSPWGSLSTPPSSPIPTLVPEVEEGNVEYKLQLLSPTPARFARLVTQLKWRLLEGGGQAYYELGVADSGMLVGLPRQQLEESLETLEMMAGEIGASVIVVKEVQVPPELAGLAESRLEKWQGRNSARRKDMLRMHIHSTSTTEFQTELSTTDVTDTEESIGCSPITLPLALGEAAISAPGIVPSNAALGEDLVADDADNEDPHGDMTSDHVTEFSASLAIAVSSVYKPRPMKKRAIHITNSPSARLCSKKKLKNGYLPSKHTDTESSEALSQPSGTAERAKTKVDASPTEDEALSKSAPQNTIPASSSLVPDLPVVDSLPPTEDVSDATSMSGEPRLIVEALVVRKLSLDEAFLDFEGFSLQ